MTMQVVNPQLTPISLRNVAVVIREDFVTGIAAASTSTSGTGAAFSINASGNNDTGGNPGWAVASTGTTTTGRAAINPFTATPLLLGYGALHCENLVKIPNLSDGTETFTLFVGLGDSASGATIDAVNFRYTDGTNGGKWQCVTRSNSVETAVDSGVTVAANTNYRLQIEINAAGTQADFSINGALVATIATNIPVGAGRQTNVLTGIVKSAGTTNRELLIAALITVLVIALIWWVLR
jgi:hypothetical protein